MTHDELRELTVEYALGILADHDRRTVEAHLLTCAECAGDVREFQQAAAALTLAVPMVSPPAALRARVLERVASSASRVSPARMTRQRPGGGVLVIVAVAATIALAVLGSYVADLHRRIRVLEDQLRVATTRAAETQQQLVRLRVASDASVQARRILAAANLRRIDLSGQNAAPRAAGRAFWSPTEGLVVAFEHLPVPPPERVYQLWVIPPGGVPISAALLEVQPDGRALASAATPGAERVETVAVTLEPAGGVPAPTGDIIVAGKLSE